MCIVGLTLCKLNGVSRFYCVSYVVHRVSLTVLVVFIVYPTSYTA